jgi:hypothetical protein
MIALGHWIGIHLDSAYYEHFENQSMLEQTLLVEAGIFLDEFGLDVSAFSFHNPTHQDLEYSKPSYLGLSNTYSVDFREKIPYVSDSNGYWRYQSISDFLKSEKAPTVQVLTHPEWWTMEALMPRERLCKALFEDVFFHINEYDDFLAAAGRENRSEILESHRGISLREMGIRSFGTVFGEYNNEKDSLR